MNSNSPFAAVPFKGELAQIDRFYEILKLRVADGRVMLENFELFFGAEELGLNDFQIVVTVDEDLSEIEDQILRIGCQIKEKGVGNSGPYLVALDPSGMKVKINLTMEKLARSLKNFD